VCRDALLHPVGHAVQHKVMPLPVKKKMGASVEQRPFLFSRKTLM
jgi:hypothetical protein